MSYKKLVLGILACLNIGSLLALPKEVRFDIHKVLVQPNRFRLAPLITGVPELLYVATRGKVVDPLFYKNPTNNQKLVAEASSLYQSGDASGEAYWHLFKKYDKERLANMVRSISNGYHPTPGMQELVDDLHAAKVTLRVASNIGSEFLKDMQERHSGLFRHFDPGKTVEFIDKHGSIVPNPTKKPQPKYFIEYDKAYPTDEEPAFVDDNKDNCKEATKHGWLSFHFKKGNIEQLRQDFINKGFLPTQ